MFVYTVFASSFSVSLLLKSGPLEEVTAAARERRNATEDAVPTAEKISPQFAVIRLNASADISPPSVAAATPKTFSPSAFQ